MNALFLLIVLLNFLIALISQSYDDVMASLEYYTNLEKLRITVDCCQIYIFLNKLFASFDLFPVDRAMVFAVAASDDLREETDLQGFVAPIKFVMTKNCTEMRDKIIAQEKSIKSLSTQMKTILEEVKKIPKPAPKEEKKEEEKKDEPKTEDKKEEVKK